MKIIDVSEEHKDLFSLCLEDWSEEAKEAGPKRRQWLDRCWNQDLRAKLALDDDGVEGGIIQYAPIFTSSTASTCTATNRDEATFESRGMGKALLTAAEEDARGVGAKGMAAWGVLVEKARLPQGRPPRDLGAVVEAIHRRRSAPALVCQDAQATRARPRESDRQKGPPSNYDKIRKLIRKRVARL